MPGCITEHALPRNINGSPLEQDDNWWIIHQMCTKNIDGGKTTFPRQVIRHKNSSWESLTDSSQILLMDFPNILWCVGFHVMGACIFVLLWFLNVQIFHHFLVSSFVLTFCCSSPLFLLETGHTPITMQNCRPVEKYWKYRRYFFFYRLARTLSEFKCFF